ncbi:uncharacterized protein [Dendrobates tinctorius]|uniref:uncharacterized protein n=1 Tax=Dendrobates tinctorius TaxID=92724 RepID=UPI003CC93B3C
MHHGDAGAHAGQTPVTHFRPAATFPICKYTTGFTPFSTRDLRRMPCPCCLLHRALLKEHLHRGITKCKEEIINIKNQLESATTTEEFNNLKTKINGIIEQHRRDTETRKRNKFARDTEDYEQNRVYKWRESYNSGNFTIRSNYRSSTDMSTSGSDYERQPSTNRFLGQRRRPTRRRGPAEERDTHRNMDFNHITRSQNQPH